jgi:hypothetical protein
MNDLITLLIEELIKLNLITHIISILAMLNGLTIMLNYYVIKKPFIYGFCIVLFIAHAIYEVCLYCVGL